MPKREPVARQLPQLLDRDGEDAVEHRLRPSARLRWLARRAETGRGDEHVLEARARDRRRAHRRRPLRASLARAPPASAVAARAARAAACRAARRCAPPVRCRARGARPAMSSASISTTIAGMSSISCFGAPSADEAAAVEDREPVTALGLVHVVRRHEDRRAALDEPEQALPEIAAALRIDCAGGLVEQQQLGPMQRRGREREALALAAAHRAGALRQRAVRDRTRASTLCDARARARAARGRRSAP